MEHLLLKAATTATDEGTFTAVISTATVDRDKDIIDPAAMVASLAKWVAVGKRVPLAYNHTDEVIGYIDPATARIKNKEVVADGWVDQKAPRGEEVWRLVKSGTLSFSFGFLFDPMTGASKLPDGGYHIKELDVFEISVIPVGPANNDTRVLNWKSAEELREEAKRVEREVEEQKIPDVPEAPAEPEIDVAAELAAVKAQLAEMREQRTKPVPVDPKAQDKQAARAARELEEIAIPDVPEVEPEPEIDLAKELQEVKAELAEMRGGLEDLVKKAEETAQGPPARAVDPLRKQADALALEIASGDRSLLNQPKTVEPKRPEPSLTLKELKQRSRDEMLGVLSGGTI